MTKNTCEDGCICRFCGTEYNVNDREAYDSIADSRIKRLETQLENATIALQRIADLGFEEGGLWARDIALNALRRSC